MGLFKLILLWLSFSIAQVSFANCFDYEVGFIVETVMAEGYVIEIISKDGKVQGVLIEEAGNVGTVESAGTRKTFFSLLRSSKPGSFLYAQFHGIDPAASKLAAQSIRSIPTTQAVEEVFLLSCSSTGTAPPVSAAQLLSKDLSKAGVKGVAVGGTRPLKVGPIYMPTGIAAFGGGACGQPILRLRATPVNLPGGATISVNSEAGCRSTSGMLGVYRDGVSLERSAINGWFSNFDIIHKRDIKDFNDAVKEKNEWNYPRSKRLACFGDPNKLHESTISGDSKLRFWVPKCPTRNTIDQIHTIDSINKLWGGFLQAILLGLMAEKAYDNAIPGGIKDPRAELAREYFRNFYVNTIAGMAGGPPGMLIGAASSLGKPVIDLKNATLSLAAARIDSLVPAEFKNCHVIILQANPDHEVDVEMRRLSTLRRKLSP